MVSVQQFGDVRLRHAGHQRNRCLAQRELRDEGAHVPNALLFPSRHELRAFYRFIIGGILTPFPFLPPPVPPGRPA